MTKIALTGALGKMGTLVLQEAAKAKDVQFVAGFDAVGAGKALANGVVVNKPSQLKEVLSEIKPDVLIDFTVANAATENVIAAASLGIDLVVGTTGISSDQYARMQNAIEGNVAAVISPNFSIGVNLFWKLVHDAAAALKDYDIEIIEAHHNQKKDAPSGTALATLKTIKDAIGERDVVFGREGIGARGREIGVHAVRAGDIVGDHTVIFAGSSERLEIKHQAHSRAVFASGAVLAAQWVAGKKPGIYSMKDVLDSR